MSAKGVIQVKGDFGNPSGSGKARTVLYDLPETDDKDTLTSRLEAFHDALVTANIVQSNRSNIGVTYNSDAAASKPGTNINIDRKVEVTWRKTGENAVHKTTLSGAHTIAGGAFELQDAGERMTEDAKAAMAAALQALYGLDPDTVVVEVAKVIQGS